MKSFRIEGGWKNGLKQFGISFLSLVIVIGVVWGLNILSDSSSNSSGSSYNPYHDDYSYEERDEPDFYDYNEYINGNEDVEACSSSGCYTLEADISDGVVNTIHFPNGGYVNIDAEIESDGSASGSDDEGNNWDITVSESLLEDAKQEYIESVAENNYDPGDYDRGY